MMTSRRLQRGFGLVELMIAVTLGLLLSTAVIQIFLATNSSSRVQESLARVQEAARFAMNFLGEDVRMAGYMGCSSIGNLAVNMIALPKPVVDLDLATALVGEDDVAEGNDLGALAGTDVLRIRRASSEFIRLTGNLSPANSNIQIEDNRLGFEQGDYVLVSDCLNADIFRITNTPKEAGKGKTTLVHASGQVNSAGRLSKVYGSDAEVFGFENVDYFLRDTGRQTSGGNPIIALYMQRLNYGTGGATSAAIELVPGVENMQIRYGVDSDGDRAVNAYQTAAAVSDWTGVLSVRISLQIVGPEENIVGRAGSSNEQALLDEGGNPIINNDGRLRQIFTNVFAIRNKLP